MKKIIFFAPVFIAVFSQEVQSQTKKWTIEECVNYALEKDEVAAGYILSCQAHPTSNKVVITFDE